MSAMTTTITGPLVSARDGNPGNRSESEVTLEGLMGAALAAESQPGPYAQELDAYLNAAIAS